jgi:hypothetical protein
VQRAVPAEPEWSFDMKSAGFGGKILTVRLNLSLGPARHEAGDVEANLRSTSASSLGKAEKIWSSSLNSP